MSGSPLRTRRRRWIAGSAALAARLVHLALTGRGAPGLALAAGGALGQSAAGLIRRGGFAFGSRIGITVAHPDAHAAKLALDDALREIAALDALLSVQMPGSPLAQLNAAGAIDAPDPRLVDVLALARRWSGLTGGAFDASVQPLWLVFARAAARGQLPARADVAQAAARIGWSGVSDSAARIELQRPGMALTLNGISQGYAADRALALLRSRGIRHALVDSGECAVLGKRAGGENWRLGIRDPRNTAGLLGSLEPGDAAVATSGDYEYVFSADRRHHHIFDPRTGYSPTELAAVTVVAPRAADADALSTACMVLGHAAARALIATLPGVEALFVFKDQRQQATGGFEALFSRG